MFARFEPADDSTDLSEKRIKLPPHTRPFRLVTVTDDAMQPALTVGQQVYVEKFNLRGLSYLEQPHAVVHEGQVLIRRLQGLPDGSIRLIPNQGENKTITPSDEWEKPADWKETGRLLPTLKSLGPLVSGYASGKERTTCYATAGWSN